MCGLYVGITVLAFTTREMYGLSYQNSRLRRNDTAHDDNDEMFVLFCL